MKTDWHSSSEFCGEWAVDPAIDAAYQPSSMQATTLGTGGAPPVVHPIGDVELAQAAYAALERSASPPLQQVKVAAAHGCITLYGEVDLPHQRADAEEAVLQVRGMRRLVNHIGVRPPATSMDIACGILAALTRSAAREARHIGVHVQGRSVTLRGEVHSLAERRAVVGAATSSPGVARVHDELRVLR